MKKIISAIIVFALVLCVAPSFAEALKVTSEFLPEAIVGEMYSAQIETDESVAEFLLITRTGGNNNFPEWLSLSEEGEISGMPLMFGTYRFWVQATDINGNTAEKELTLVIKPGSDVAPLVMQTAELPEATTGAWYSMQLVASGDSPLSFSIADATDTRPNQFPSELNLSVDGYISGTPLTAGEYRFTVELFNDYEVVYCDYVLTVTDPPLVIAAAPVIGTQPKSNECKSGDQVSAVVSASTSDAGILSYQWYQTASPTYSSATRLTGETSPVLSFEAGEAGIYYYFVSVTNTLGESKTSATSEIIAVTVYEGEQEPEPQPEPEPTVPGWIFFAFAVLAVLVIVLAILLIKTRGTKRTEFRF